MNVPHAIQIATLHQVVSRLAARLTTPPDAVPAALALVEGWLRGEPVGLSDLAAAGSAAREAGRPLFGSDKAASWCCTAAANLCWMARGERGWENGLRTISDASASALHKEVPEARAVIDGWIEEALQHATRAVDPDVPRAAPPEPLPLPDLRPLIGDIAAAALFAQGANIDPRLRASREDLIALLEELDYPAHPAVLRFDAHFGGVRTDEHNLGAYANLTLGLLERGGRDDLVPVASHGDVASFLDAEGRAWVQDLIEDAEARPIAASGEVMIARNALFWIWTFTRSERLQGHRGAELAAALGVPRVPEASDHMGGSWAHDTGAILETRWGGDVTLVYGDLVERLSFDQTTDGDQT